MEDFHRLLHSISSIDMPLVMLFGINLLLHVVHPYKSNFDVSMLNSWRSIDCGYAVGEEMFSGAISGGRDKKCA